MSKTFGEILKEARKNKHLTSFEAAKLLQIPQSTYSKYENDNTVNVNIELLKRICTVFEVDIFRDLGGYDIEQINVESKGEDKEALIKQLKFCNDKILKILQEMITRKGFDEELINLYVSYQKFRDDILTKY